MTHAIDHLLRKATAPLSPEATAVLQLATAVWKELGSGHCEAIYRNALALALALGQSFRRAAVVRCEVPVPVWFRDHNIGVGYADVVLFVDEIDPPYAQVPSIVFELKSVRGKITTAHTAQCRAYVRGLGAAHGFVINFSDEGEPEVVSVKP